MENLNEGKKKASAYMAELAEIDKQSAVVAMEAKINKLAEMVEAKPKDYLWLAKTKTYLNLLIRNELK